MYVPHGDGVILAASQGGAATHPAWYHNLVAHPEIEVEQSGQRTKLRARLADADEKAKLWPICVEHYAPYDEYQRKTTRDIPLFVCEP
jgi:deazaflavin-dependent oxidoreductase (nitroreductase family)